jgi:hypothetical protein
MQLMVEHPGRWDETWIGVEKQFDRHLCDIVIIQQLHILFEQLRFGSLFFSSWLPHWHYDQPSEHKFLSNLPPRTAAADESILSHLRCLGLTGACERQRSEWLRWEGALFDAC